MRPEPFRTLYHSPMTHFFAKFLLHGLPAAFPARPRVGKECSKSSPTRAAEPNGPPVHPPAPIGRRGPALQVYVNDQLDAAPFGFLKGPVYDIVVIIPQFAYEEVQQFGKIPSVIPFLAG